MPKFLGMEPKTYLWVGGGLVALIVIYYVMKSRSGGAGVAAGGDTGGGGLMGGGISGSSPVSYAPGAPDSAGDRYQQQLNDLDVLAQEETLREQKARFDLQQQQGTQYLDFLGKQNELALQGAQQQLSVSGAAADLATAQLGQTTKEVQSGKIKGECGKGESSYFDRNTGQFMCKPSGKSGAKKATDAIGNVALDAALAYESQYLNRLNAPRKGKGKSSSGTSGVDRSTDYSTQHFNIPGNLFG